MSAPVILLVLLAGLLHAIWNAVAKNITDQFASFALLNIGAACASWALLPFVGLPKSSAWIYLLSSVVLHCTYELLLMGAFRRGDFSKSYPIARGVAPLLVALGGFLFANQHQNALSLIGIFVIVSGVLSLALIKGAKVNASSATLWAVATGVGIAIYSVVDGLGVRSAHSSAKYGVTLFVLQSTLWLVVSFIRRGASWWPAPATARIGIVAGALSIAGYLLILWAQQHASFALVSALRETGVLWAAVIGALYFKEGSLRKTVGPAVVIVIGISLLAVG